MKYSKEFSESVTVRDKVQRSKEYYQKNYWFIALNVILILLTSSLGFWLTGFWGVIFGIIVGLLSYFYLPQGIDKIKEIYN